MTRIATPTKMPGTGWASFLGFTTPSRPFTLSFCLPLQRNWVEREHIRLDHPQFVPGDTVKVHVKIKEGEKERIQVFQGVVISKRKGSVNASFTVRKVSYGIGVERIFPLHSPIINYIEVITKGRVRRAKIYYLRKLRGKAARIKEKRFK